MTEHRPNHKSISHEEEVSMDTPGSTADSVSGRTIGGEFSTLTLALAMIGFESMKERTHPSSAELIAALDRGLEEIRNAVRKNGYLATPPIR